MQIDIYERAGRLGNFMIEKKATVRQTGKAFGISKSTVYKDVTQILPQVNPILAQEVQSVLQINREQRHIRGGQATKRKYLTIK